jgi:hypothetical protein
MVDLNSLISPSSGWTIASATAINDAGWIAGFGINAAGDIRALLLTPSTVPTLPGDANGDGTVNGADLNTVLSNYNQTGTDWAHGDFNGDGSVNGADLNTVLSSYSQTHGGLPGDANGDGTVDGADLNTVLSNYNLTGTDWAHGDFNGDGAVNGADLNTILSNYNQSQALASVPEPSTLVLLALGCFVLVTLRVRLR